MRIGLTEAMERARSSTALDLACGYPGFNVPGWIMSIVSDVNADATLALKSGGLGPGDQSAIASARLVEAASTFLGLTEARSSRILVTSSGSLAIDRAIAALSPGRRPLVHEPEMDVINSLLRQHSGVEESVLPLDLGTSSLSADLEGRRDPCLLAFSSPHNPTGAQLTTQYVGELQAWCRETGSALIVDQCFLELYSGQQPVRAWEHLSDDIEWIVIWDTGKTIGLQHEKLAFLICSAPAYAKAVETLRVVQFDLPNRLKRLFAEVLSHEELQLTIQRYRDQIAANKKFLQDELKKHFAVLTPSTTSFVSLCLPLHESPDDFALNLLNAAGVAVVPGTAFCPRQIGPSQFVRLSVGREPEYLDVAAQRICRWLEFAKGK